MKLIKLSQLLFLIVLFNNSLNAQQNYSVQEGKIVDRKKNPIYEFIGEDTGSIFYINYKSRDRYIEKTDIHQNVKASVLIPRYELNTENKTYFQYAFIMRDYLAFIYSSEDKLKNEYVTYIRKYNKETLKPEGSYVELMRVAIPEKKMVMLTPLSNPQYLQDVISTVNQKNYYVSDDKTKFMLYRNINYTDKNSPEKLNLTVFDLDLNRLWEKEYTMRFATKDFTISSILLNNSGNVYITGIHYLNGQEASAQRREKKQDYTYHVISFKDNGLVIKNTPIQLKNNFISDFKIGLKNDGEPFAVGFYSQKESSSIQGVFHITFDSETSEISNEVETLFEKEFIQEGLDKFDLKKSNKSADKGDLKMMNHDLRALVVNKNNEVTLVAERFYVTSTTYVDASGRTTSVPVYNYNEMIIISFSSNGTIRWKTKVQKRQTGSEYSSFAIIPTTSKIFIVFNDDQKNISLSPEDTPNQLTNKNYGLMIIELNCESGEFVRNLILPRSNNDIMLKPRKALVSQNGTAIFYGDYMGRKYQFVEIRFDQN
jgi:hypothetical protein